MIARRRLRKLLRVTRELSSWPSVLKRRAQGIELESLRLRDGTVIRSPGQESLWNHFSSIWLDRCYTTGLRLGPDDLVVDIGANVGLFTLFAARSGASVLAVEPATTTFAQLCQNVATSPNSGRVLTVHAAITSHDGAVPLYYNPTETTATGIFGREIDCHYEVVRALSLETLLDLHHISHCRLLKLDCEGAEFDIVMETSIDVLRRAETIVAEVHERIARRNIADLRETLEAAGFTTSATPLAEGFHMMSAERR